MESVVDDESTTDPVERHDSFPVLMPLYHRQHHPPPTPTTTKPNTTTSPTQALLPSILSDADYCLFFKRPDLSPCGWGGWGDDI